MGTGTLGSARVWDKGAAWVAALALMGMTACTGAPAAPAAPPTTAPTAAAPAPTAAAAAPTAAAAQKPAVGTCGSIPNVPPQDPTNLLASLPPNVSGMYNGASTPIQASAWSAWKPKHDAPFTVGVLFDALVNPFQTGAFNMIQQNLQKSPLVKNVIAGSVATGGDAPSQVQQLDSMVQQGADIILLQAGSASALQPAVEAAGKSGVPTIGVISPIGSTYAFNVSPNEFVDASRSASALLTGLNGTGTIVEVHGIPATQVDADAFAAFKAVLANCPNITVAGEVVGNFAPPLAKAATLQFLSTHPQQIDGVLQTASMAPSIMQAFQQSGRTIPPVTDIQAQNASLGYWLQNKASYHGIAVASGPTSYANLVSRAALRILAGQGPKLNTLLFTNPLITADNLAQYAQDGWDLTTPGTAEAPQSAWLTDADLDPLFNHPELKQGVSL